ncbi:heparan sulfate glucosamine 3-O-sulfotransferase 5-like isoform X3 [Amphibalanus amphitrite]|uniref:heparan sulfate glucosamine 3-O-sulfotransferase 5-like isoform X3 n=1 Tax=Amphibalanus amphitrite TaxID=1232801 RepID=UPI001C907B53|nr:heparan sulfate glucosamine 3-O-sulfotransferase 5-like isoform X3 [Amphibalanus amphitrite]
MNVSDCCSVTSICCIIGFRRSSLVCLCVATGVGWPGGRLRCWSGMWGGEAPAGRCRRLLVTTVLLLLLVVTMLLYRLCYSSPGTVVCARAGAGRLHFPHTRRRLPGAIIIGARKAGTRALLEMMNVHPQVMRASREVHFFDRDNNYRRGLDWYRRRMPLSFDDQITVEKSPSYLVTQTVPERVARMNQTIRLLVVVREPVARLISDYAQYLDKGARGGKPRLRLPELVLRPNGSVRTESRLVKISIYHRHVRRWLQHFPSEALLIVDGDRLVREPLPELRRVEKHLRLPPYLNENHFYFNDTKGFYCIANDNGSKCLAESKGRKHPPTDPQLVQKLRRFFAPHNRKFYRLTQKNYSWPET